MYALRLAVLSHFYFNPLYSRCYAAVPTQDGVRHRIPRQIKKSSLHFNASEVQAAFSLP
ncbi:hypothetical protein HMPREF9098_2170 [Kingella denitrificans ATCC 33394]|uniref:Uncharacterized protein n=1 Tax=Kingella denitrificans ATCC 33394 TaxID=888741 RepID=F0F235_9NEIS|nr:hypothetical protein HMPREF9098_2170 [Kingella denitrificans ATCC 33394]